MTEDLKALRKIAEAATPGPWETLGGQGPFGTHAVCHRMEQGTLVEIAYRDAHFDKANAVHIATFDPPTVLALIEALARVSTLFVGVTINHGNGVTEDLNATIRATIARALDGDTRGE